MEHLFLFLDTLSLLLGFGTFLIFFYVTFQSKDRTMIHILVFFSAFTLDMIFTTIYGYLAHNVTDVFSEFAQLLFYLQIGIGAFLIFSIPFFTAELVKLKQYKIINLIFLIVAVGQFSGVIFTDHSEIIFRVGILTAIMFSAICLVHQFKKIPVKANQKLVIRMGVIALLSIITNLFQLLDLIILFRILVPVLYGLTSLVFILHIIENYFTNDRLSNKNQQEHDQYGFTKREKEVIALLLKGYSNKKIAELMYISLSTVKSHIHNVFKKTKVSNRYEFIHLMKFKHLS